MCAKVTGPLYSMTASGKLADAMVFFSWKGIAVVRQWLIPKNKKSVDQGDVRVILGGLGRCTKPVVKDSSYHRDATFLAVGGTTWVSQLVKFVREKYMADGAKFDIEWGVFDTLANDELWESNAVAIGLAAFDLPYKGMTNTFVAGMQLYELAKYAVNQHGLDPDLFTAAIYEKALGTWEAADFTAFKADIQTVI